MHCDICVYFVNGNAKKIPMALSRAMVMPSAKLRILEYTDFQLCREYDHSSHQEYDHSSQ